MAPSAAWTSPVSGPRSNFEKSLGYFSHNIKRMCHEKFQGPTTFLLGCRGGGGPGRLGPSRFIGGERCCHLKGIEFGRNRDTLSYLQLTMGVWQRVTMDSPNFTRTHHALPFYALRAAHPRNGLFRGGPNAGPAAFFCPFGHPTPYAYTTYNELSSYLEHT
jgi:hypothetical protein